MNTLPHAPILQNHAYRTYPAMQKILTKFLFLNPLPTSPTLLKFNQKITTQKPMQTSTKQQDNKTPEN